MIEKKIDKLRQYIAAGDQIKAISLASKFPRLGDIRDAVLDAQMAVTNPRFARQIGKCPDSLIARGWAAICAQYTART